MSALAPGLTGALTSLSGLLEPRPPHDRAAEWRLARAAESQLLPRPFRSGRLVAWSPHTTTWDVWDGENLARCLLQLGEEALPPAHPWLHPVVAIPGGLRTPAIGWTLADLLPVNEPPAWGPRVLVEVLAGLGALHAAGLGHGQVCPELVVWTGSRFVLVPLLAPGAVPIDDVVALAALVRPLIGEPALVELIDGMAAIPPTDAVAVIPLLRRAMADALTRMRHALEQRGRSMGTDHDVRRLLDLAARLRQPPPIGRGCLKASAEGFFLLESDGITVRGGWAGTTSNLPVIVGDDGLSAGAARAATRAWLTRRGGDEALRRAFQARMGSDDLTTERLIRWLMAAARLRAETLLLRAR